MERRGPSWALRRIRIWLLALFGLVVGALPAMRGTRIPVVDALAAWI